MSGNLVDAQGFPRADIDVHAVRVQRNRFATLRTDHKMIVGEMEKLMHIALAPPANRDEASQAGPSPSTTTTQPSAPDMSSSTQTTQPSSSASPVTPSPSSTEPTRPSPPLAATVPRVAANGAPPQRRRIPFALVDIVSPGSPAEQADMKVQDKIVAFGTVSLNAFATPSMALGALPGLLREYENRPMEILVDRESSGPQQNLVTLNLTPQRWSGQGLLGCHVVPLQVSQTDQIYQPEVATATERHSTSLRPQ